MSKIMSYWSSSDRFISLIFTQDPSMLLQMTGFHSFSWLSSIPLFSGRTDAEAEAPILRSPEAKSQLTGKDLDAGKDWGQKEKGATKDEMIGWHHWLIGLEFEQTLRGSEGQGSLACCSPWGLRVGCDWATEQHKSYPPHIFIHSSTVGHFNCFHILATVNNALVTIYLSSMFSCPLDKYQKTSWVIW